MPKNIHLFFTILLVFYCISKQVIAQDSLPKTLKDDSISHKYKKNYADLLHIRLYGISTYNRFFLNRDGQVLTERLSYSPNRNLNLGGAFGYKWLALALAFDFPFINQDNASKGETKSFDFQLAILTKKVIVETYYQENFGYYVTDPKVIDKTWKEGDEYPQRPDLRSTTAGITTHYLFKPHKFSYKAAFIQTERQLKSAGTPVISALASYYYLAGDSSIIPKLNTRFNPRERFKYGDFYSLGLSGGYIHTFVVKQSFFCTVGASVGAAYTYKVYKDDRQEHLNYDSSGSFLLNGRFSAGYNGNRFFTGLNFVFNTYRIPLTNTFNLGYEIGTFKFYIGYRLPLADKYKVI